VVSTIAIEAAIFDTPVVNVVRRSGSRCRSCGRRSATAVTHWANIAANGAIRDAATPGQMLELVGRYLDHPSSIAKAAQECSTSASFWMARANASPDSWRRKSRP
jgi:hypothetical protein